MKPQYCHPIGLSDEQLQCVLSHVALVAMPWRTQFLKSFMNHLSRARLERGGAVTNEQVAAACAFAISGAGAAASTAPPCGFDASQEGPPGRNAELFVLSNTAQDGFNDCDGTAHA
jgi:hypothetical protein